MRKRSAANIPPAPASEPDPLDAEDHAVVRTAEPGTPPKVIDVAKKALGIAKGISRDTSKPVKRYDFRSAHERTNKDAELRDDLVNIVETVWIEDVYASWRRIKDSLRVGPRRSEAGILARKLDEARGLSYEAHRLYVTAQREYDRWELENEVVFSAMWNEASRAVEAERVDKVRTKPITDTDVRSKIMTLHPGEYIAQETKRKAVKLTVANMTALVKEANEHVEDIRVMLAKLRAS